MNDCNTCRYEDLDLEEEPCKGCRVFDNYEDARGCGKQEAVAQGILASQIGGSHYQLPIQPIEYIVKNNLGYREGNVIKYTTRHKTKNGAEDIKKAIHYLEMILEDYENE